MKRVLRALFLTAALAGAAASSSQAVAPIACSDCTCRAKCETLCTRPDGLISVCGVSGRCPSSPVCQG